MRFKEFFKPGARRYGNGAGNDPLISRLARVPAYRDALPELLAEFARARRYQRPLSVLVMRFNGSANGTREQSEPVYMQLMVGLLLGGILPERLRETDQACCDVATARYIILMPELSKSQAQDAVRRLSTLVRERVPAATSIGVAEFPKDGLTLEEVIAAADRNGHTTATHAVAAV